MREVLLDTEMLVLWIVGHVDLGKIGVHRRLKSWQSDDFERLKERLTQFKDHITTPHVLTEASNLIGSGKQVIATGACDALAVYCQNCKKERFVQSKVLVKNKSYLKLGLADVGILQAAAKGATVITADYELYGKLKKADCRAINFRHEQTPAV